MTPAVERLRAFIAEMLEWETTFHAERRPQNHRLDPTWDARQTDRDAREKLKRIFNAYLSAKALETRAGRISSIDTSRPPEFAQQVLEETACKVGKVIYIETLNEKYLAPHRRYALVLEEGSPRIDAVFSRVDATAKWRKQYAI